MVWVKETFMLVWIKIAIGPLNYPLQFATTHKKSMLHNALNAYNFFVHFASIKNWSDLDWLDQFPNCRMSKISKIICSQEGITVIFPVVAFPSSFYDFLPGHKIQDKIILEQFWCIFYSNMSKKVDTQKKRKKDPRRVEYNKTRPLESR